MPEIQLYILSKAFLLNTNQLFCRYKDIQDMLSNLKSNLFFGKNEVMNIMTMLFMLAVELHAPQAFCAK